MHIHLGIVHAIVVFLQVAIVGAFWRIVAAHNNENSLGRAMAFLY